MEQLRHKMYKRYQETKDLQEVVAVSQELDKLLNQYSYTKTS
ncbi:aspartyl-phosphate phosphatase Spo0E family protein [Natronobacillus azotifigens]|uniref:Aspartyl-phosphate phosphatase Spo0E family protein n=1 Tax=Natronobacillus azotifigens TaxID=472978 RepID=A0A9J6RA53_9BACI|nr:aspartyl-phosphate phosphatase Spo0E family protein [Natronobacillus azotifigens]